MNNYVTTQYYFSTFRGNVIPANELEKFLKDASEIVDILTYNRISLLGGFAALTDFEKEKIQRATCLIADFYKQNENELKMIIDSYSIEGVNATFFSSQNCKNINGVIIPAIALEILNQTCLRNTRFYI